ncbi:UBA-e1-C domain-containing protein [Aphelenchoides fujianensis]|nr:UBA-e1-C domain-containing protein [Aphelenchoides fujianensis]
MPSTADEQRPPMKRVKTGRSWEAPVPEKMEVDGEKIDSHAYSRQIYAIGESAMLKLRKSSVLISGMGGVGVEIAKNLVLGGVRRVAVHDTRAAEWRDLSAQFFLNERDLGKNRAAACFSKLQELNDSVQCTLHTEELSEALVSQFDLIVLTDTPFGRQVEVNDSFRPMPAALFSYAFVDLGPRFQVDDPNGEPSREVLVEFVDRASGDVHTLDGLLHGFEDGDHVQFAEVRGMSELNTCEPRKITVVTALDAPEFVVWDFAHFEAPAHLHALWRALYSFEEKHGRSPGVRSLEDFRLLKEELAAFTKEEIPEEWTKNFSFQVESPFELNGFLYTHHLEALPGSYSSFDADKLTEEDCKPRNNRYDGQAAVFGWPFQEALLQQKWFVVGAGAIGCELLKNFAMMGVGCSPEGRLKLTDMDQIELSNLNRQFLFRRADIGRKKSEVAARAAKAFNPALNIEALTERVAEDTEHVSSAGLSGVANALDNVDARRYMDRRCVFYELPLLESGTMGAKGNTQVVYPHLTESYASTNDPPEKETPVCTLKHFPYEIQHTIQWARGRFEDLFTTPAETANRYLKDVRGFLQRLEHMSEGERIQRALIDERPRTAADCIKWARDLFQRNFHDEIAQLLHNFPPEQTTPNGVKFWSGTKRCPRVLEFDVNEKFHFDFVYAASILRASSVQTGADRRPRGVRPRGHEATRRPPSAPASGVKIAVTEAEAQAEGRRTNSPSLGLQLSNTQLLEVIDFEKDDDSNHHVEFVTAASNLRAANYGIPQADAMRTKQIAGRIIPALSTTTAVVAGLVSVELYKTVEKEGGRSKAPLERFKNAFFNLAGPLYAFSEPGRAPKKKYGEREFTLWDRLEIRGPKTLKEKETGLEVSMLSCGVSLLYAFFQPPAKIKERMDKNILDVLAEVTRQPVAAHRRSFVFEATTSDENDEDVEIPFIVYRI